MKIAKSQVVLWRAKGIHLLAEIMISTSVTNFNDFSTLVHHSIWLILIASSQLLPLSLISTAIVLFKSFSSLTPPNLINCLHLLPSIYTAIRRQQTVAHRLKSAGNTRPQPHSFTYCLMMPLVLQLQNWTVSKETVGWIMALKKIYPPNLWKP